jgi:hypothetical protein
MAHPYHMHREQQVAHRRVGPHLKEHPSGATKLAKGTAFSKVTSKTAAENHDSKPEGRKGYARGGKVKGNTTNIIITGGGGAQKQPVPVPVPGPPAGGPPMGPPPGGPPMGAMPGGPPPGVPMRAKGGRVLGGDATKDNLDAWSARAAKNSYAKGGRISAGAESGVGRLQKARAAKRK